MKHVRSFAELARGLVLRPLVREPGRTALTVAGIAVGIAVIVAIQLANQSALRSFSESVDAVAGRANFQIAPDAGMLDENVLVALQPLWLERVRFAPVIDVEALVQPQGLPVRILGVDLMSDLHFRDYRWTRIATGDQIATLEGEQQPSIEAFLSLFREGSAIVPETFATEQDLAPGDALRVLFRSRTAELEVRGILQPRGPATAFNGSLLVLDIATAQSALGLEGRLSRIDLILPEPVPERISSFLASRLPAGSRLERPSRRNERVDRMLRAFRVNLYGLAAVALLVGVFLVYNTVLVSILRRRRDIGVVRTVGVSARQILFVFIGEGVAFGLIGSALGILLGWAMARGALDLVGRTVNQLYVTTAPSEIELRLPLILVGITLGVAVSVLAALQPAWEAAHLPPNAMIRPGLYQRVAKRFGSGLAVSALATFVVAWSLTRVPPVGGIAVGGYVSVALAIAGFALLTPLALQTLSALLGAVYARPFPVAGRLAAASIPASLRRTAIATAALMTAIAMMVSVAIMIGSFRETVDAWVGQTVQSDLWIRPAQGLTNSDVATLPPEVAEEVRAMPEVAAIDRYRGMEVVWRESLITVGSGEFEVLQSWGSIPMVEPSSHRAAVGRALRERGVLISESLALRHDLRTGQVLEIPTPSGPGSFPIAGIYRDYSNDRGIVVMDRSAWIETFGDRDSNTIAVFLREGVDPVQARRAIEERVSSRWGAFVLTNATIRTEVLRIFDQTFLITWALLGVALIVAVLGIINTLTAMILERRREIAMLLVIGMDRAQITATIVLEASILGIASTGMGLMCGWVLSWILIFVINRQSFGWTIEFDPPALVVAFSLAATFLATLASALVPARLARRVRMAAELKGE